MNTLKRIIVNVIKGDKHQHAGDAATASSGRIHMKACIFSIILLAASANAGYAQNDPLVVSPNGSVTVNGPFIVQGSAAVSGSLTVQGTVVISVPIGSVMAWHKTIGGGIPLPDGWVECNGQTINDPQSPLNGAIVPDLNDFAHQGASNRGSFIRGTSNSADVGTAQGDAIRNIVGTFDAQGFIRGNGQETGPFYAINYGRIDDDTSDASDYARLRGFDASRVVPTADENRPKNFRLVWIMRVK